MAGTFNVNILGCGSAVPSLVHMPSSQVIDVRERLLMIDCGEGTQLQMRRMKLKYSRLSHIFISHLHGDHFLGLPGLISTLALQDKGGTLTVHTFAEGADILQRILGVFCREMPFEIQYDIIDPAGGQTIVDDSAITVTTFPLYHRVPCVGFMISEKPGLRHIRRDMIDFLKVPVSQLQAIREGADFVTEDGRVFTNDRLTTPADPVRRYAYASDTLFDERVAEAVKGVDVLYHEATYGDEYTDKAHTRGHATAREAGRIAKMAGVGRLVIGHYSKRYITSEGLLAEASEEFANTAAAQEGMVIEL